MHKRLISLSTMIILAISLVGCSFNKDNNVVKEDNNKPNTKASSNKDNNEDTSKDTTKNDDKIKEDTTISKIDTSTLDNTSVGWFFTPNKDHRTPDVNNALNYDLNTYDAIYNGDTTPDSKSLYLTFDEGYENGYTSKILDILKEKNVKALFFVTEPYIDSNPDLIKRMVAEGHQVGNHTSSHPSMPDKTSDETTFNKEFSDVEDKYKELTGKDISKFIRPPMGKYSEKSLAMTKNLGYKTVFWSFAYEDWDPEKQPEPTAANQKIMDNLHDGSILLLHAVSKTNTELLPSIIDDAKSEGYEFKLLK